ncbi:MAG: hypothetical protein J5753_00110, partial [Oscillospiraceae bacterium]|nr:hypothetical protein [Oscillospiraceae bacterium]
MNEQDFFEIMDGLPARQIAEAAEWKYRRGKDNGNEIDTILSSDTMPEKIILRNTQPEADKTADEPVMMHAQPRAEKQSRVIRSATAGLAAVAAVFALIFGGIALKLHRDNTEIEASMPGTVLTEVSDAQTTGTDLAALTVAPTGDLTTAETTTVTFAPSEKPVPQKPDASVAAGELNFLGGHGLLRPVIAEGEPSILQDDDYLYLYGSERIRKSGLDARSQPAISLICGQLNCEHNSEDCLLYKYGTRNLMCSGGEIYYLDRSTESLMPGYAGGLNRILSDGTTEPLHPQKNFSADDESSGKIIGSTYYTHVTRLGDTGIYYLKNYGLAYSADTPDDAVTYGAPMLLNSRTGETLTLQLGAERYGIIDDDYSDDYAVMFDEASGHLFMSLYDLAGNNDGIAEIDIYTGEILDEYQTWETETELVSWFVKDHQLHFLGQSQKDRYQTNWYVRDMDTKECKVILEDCGLNSFAYCDGRVYATHHESVGNDAVYSYALDGTDMTVLAESDNSFNSLMPVA